MRAQRAIKGQVQIAGLGGSDTVVHTGHLVRNLLLAGISLAGLAVHLLGTHVTDPGGVVLSATTGGPHPVPRLAGRALANR